LTASAWLQKRLGPPGWRSVDPVGRNARLRFRDRPLILTFQMDREPLAAMVLRLAWVGKTIPLEACHEADPLLRRVVRSLGRLRLRLD
jgi:hypothetical protein